MQPRNNLGLLRLTGHLLFGRYWQKQMADELRLSQRTVNRWVKGDTTIPDMLADGSGFVERMHELLEKRKTDIESALLVVENNLPTARPGVEPVTSC